MESDPYLLTIIAIGNYIQPITVGVIVSLLATVLLLIFSAFISGSEVAVFSLEPNDLDEIRRSTETKEKLLRRLISKPDKLLATILIANNFINVAIVMLSAYITGALFDFSQHEMLGFVIQVLIVTFLLLLFGEILPKVYASSNALNFALFMTKPLQVLSRVFSPISRILISSTNIFNNRMARKSQNLSMDDLSTALQLTSEELEEDKEILEGIIKFGNISVAEIMTARVDVTDLNIKSDFNKAIAVIVESGYSRIPVFQNSPDNIKGVLYIKDLIPHLNKGNTFRWQSLIRPAYFVPETKKISDLLEDFQTNKIHLAVVIDEYGGTCGIITLEDILEEIVGEISDEFDVDESLYQLEADGSFIFNGKVQLNDFYKITELDESVFDEYRGDADSLAGLILETTNDLPDKNDVVLINNCRFKVLAVDDRRIKKIQYFPKAENEESEEV